MISNLTHRRYEEHDAYDIHLRQHESGLINRKWFTTMLQNENSGLWTFFLGEKIIAIIGFWERWPGVAQVLVVPSIYATECPHQFVRAVKRHIVNMNKVLNYHRLQTESWANDNTDKWMRLIGFTCEGTLKSFSANKDDYRMWAIVKEE
jgi:hypothetical protein